MIKKTIKLMIPILLVLATAAICTAQQASSKGLPQGVIPVTTDGYTMTVKINGKNCKANFMLAGGETNQIVGFYNGDKYIGLPYDKRFFVVGKKISLDDFNADLTTNDAVQVWNGRKGEIEITKVNGKWVEGKFFFTGYSYDNKYSIQVTNGFFRIAPGK